MGKTSQPRALDAHERRMVAVEAGADPRSVDKALAGGSLRPSVRHRIERAVTDLRRSGRLPDLEGDRGRP